MQFLLKVDENVKESLQIVLENVDHNWNLVYEDGDMKVQYELCRSWYCCPRSKTYRLYR